MAPKVERRTVLAGVGVLGLIGCSPRREAEARPAAQPERPALTAGPLDLSDLEARHGGRLGFACFDTAGGRSVAWRAAERFLYCSTFKALLAAATLERVQRGEERLDRLVPILASDILSHAPVTGPATGASLTIEALCQAAVELSDNPAANILIRELGGLDAWRDWYRRLGDQITRVDRLELELNRADGDKDTTTPQQTVRNLQALFAGHGGPLEAEGRARLLQWMTDTPTGADRIRAGVPAGWRVAHKTGTGEGPVNDIGLAYPASGRPLIVAAYYHAAPGSSAAARDAVIAQAVRLGLETLGHG